jgi:voltage-gated potassium channel
LTSNGSGLLIKPNRQTGAMTAGKSTADEARVEAWQRSMEWPMALLAIVFLAVYTTDVLATGIGPGWHNALRVVDYLIWALFAVEFVVRLVLATHRRRYAWRHAFDIVVLIVPFLRALRVFRLVYLLRSLNRWALDSLRGRVIVYGASGAVLFIFCGALAVYDAERGHSGANITTFSDAMWWAAVTIFTVGYGDRFPVTGEGRLVAVLLMASGVALVGAVTASFATWLIEKVRAQEEADQTATRRDLQAVHAQLDRVEREMVEIKRLLRERQPDDRQVGVDRPASASS